MLKVSTLMLVRYVCTHMHLTEFCTQHRSDHDDSTSCGMKWKLKQLLLKLQRLCCKWKSLSSTCCGNTNVSISISLNLSSYFVQNIHE